jgi:hypothetical protein
MSALMDGWQRLEQKIESDRYWANHMISLAIGRELGLW